MELKSEEVNKEKNTSKRLEILKNSLAKKEQEMSRRIDEHFKDVKRANGQPLNDKRNGKSTLNRWEKQNDAIRNLNQEIEKTKRAIEIEESKLQAVDKANSYIPKEILELVEKGELIQWRKYPNTFFVFGVDKARIVWIDKTKEVGYKYLSEVTDKEQRAKFIKIYNSLNALINKPTQKFDDKDENKDKKAKRNMDISEIRKEALKKSKMPDKPLVFSDKETQEKTAIKSMELSFETFKGRAKAKKDKSGIEVGIVENGDYLFFKKYLFEETPEIKTNAKAIERAYQDYLKESKKGKEVQIDLFKIKKESIRKNIPKSAFVFGRKEFANEVKAKIYVLDDFSKEKVPNIEITEKDIVTQFGLLCAKDENRPQLNNVYLEKQKGIFATDAHKLGLCISNKIKSKDGIYKKGVFIEKLPEKGFGVHSAYSVIPNDPKRIVKSISAGSIDVAEFRKFLDCASQLTDSPARNYVNFYNFGIKDVFFIDPKNAYGVFDCAYKLGIERLEFYRYTKDPHERAIVLFAEKDEFYFIFIIMPIIYMVHDIVANEKIDSIPVLYQKGKNNINIPFAKKIKNKIAVEDKDDNFLLFGKNVFLVKDGVMYIFFSRVSKHGPFRAFLSFETEGKIDDGIYTYNSSLCVLSKSLYEAKKESIFKDLSGNDIDSFKLIKEGEFGKAYSITDKLDADDILFIEGFINQNPFKDKVYTLEEIKEELLEEKPKKSKPKQPEKERVEESGKYDVYAYQIPVSMVHTDLERFQPRASAYNEELVKSIVSDFKEQKLVPILVWFDGQKGHFYVLSGHSRLEAFKRMDRKKIPAIVFEGSESDAIKKAMESNVNLTSDEFDKEIQTAIEMIKQGKSESEIQKEVSLTLTTIKKMMSLNPKGVVVKEFLSQSAEERAIKGTDELVLFVAKMMKKHELPKEQESAVLEIAKKGAAKDVDAYLAAVSIMGKTTAGKNTVPNLKAFERFEEDSVLKEKFRELTKSQNSAEMLAEHAEENEEAKECFFEARKKWINLKNKLVNDLKKSI